jgi:hypothetical protein
MTLLVEMPDYGLEADIGCYQDVVKACRGAGVPKEADRLQAIVDDMIKAQQADAGEADAYRQRRQRLSSASNSNTTAAAATAAAAQHKAESDGSAGEAPGSPADNE